MAGLFVFEGADNVGKTTVIREVEKRLHTEGLITKSFSFPGKEAGTIGAHIYELHHDPIRFGITHQSQLSLQLLHVAAHIDTIEQRILPLLQVGGTVLLDRYWWSTWAYATAASVPRDQLEAIISVEKLVWGDIAPTMLFLLSRTQVITEPSLLDAYKSLVKSEASCYPIIPIENNGTLDSTIDTVMTAILDAPQ